jgi:hypothetical protein
MKETIIDVIIKRVITNKREVEIYNALIPEYCKLFLDDKRVLFRDTNDILELISDQFQLEDGEEIINFKVDISDIQLDVTEFEYLLNHQREYNKKVS